MAATGRNQQKAAHWRGLVQADTGLNDPERTPQGCGVASVGT